MAALKNPLDVDDPAGRQAFYEALVAHGAPLVRDERMRAFRAGLIDEQAHLSTSSR